MGSDLDNDLNDDPADDELDWIEDTDHIPSPSSWFLVVWIAASLLLVLVRLGPIFVSLKPFMTKVTVTEFQLLFAIAGCLVAGWAVAGAILIVIYWRRGFVWKLEPGEWIMLCLAWAVLPDVVIATFHVLGFAQAPTWISQWGPAIILGVITLPWLAAAQLEEDRSLWSSLFLVIAIGLILLTVLSVLVALKIEIDWKLRAPLIVVLLLIPVLLSTAMVQDKKREIAQGWLHRSGIATLVLTAVMVGVAFVMTANAPQPPAQFPPQQQGFPRHMR